MTYDSCDCKELSICIPLQLVTERERVFQGSDQTVRVKDVYSLCASAKDARHFAAAI